MAISKIAPAQVQRFAAFFAGHSGAYGAMWCDPVTGEKLQARTVIEPVVDALYSEHLTGAGPVLGITPIREDSSCFFGAIDIDDDGIDLAALEARVAAHDLPLVVCRSKSGGAHLYCFLREAVPAATLVAALKKWRCVLGHENNESGEPVEIFPKQTRLGPDQLGNWINLPYHDHATTKLRYAVGPGGRRLSLDEFFDYAQRRSADERYLLAAAGDTSAGPFGDGPPCLRTLHQQSFPEGTRNTGLFNVGLYFRAKHPDNWDEKLKEYNKSLTQSLDTSELAGVIRNISREEGYAYTCQNHPLEALCKRAACKKVPYGIGFFIKANRLAELPELSELVKVKTNPPRYRVKVNGAEVSCSSEELLSAILFKRIIFERLNLVITPPRASEWDELLRPLFQEFKEEEAPVEAGDDGILYTLLSDFLLQRFRADSVESLLLGLPWLDPETNRVYFRATDFVSFLQRRQFRKFEVNQLYALLHQARGLTFETRPIKGAQVNLWSVPEPGDGEEQTEPFGYVESKQLPAY